MLKADTHRCGAGFLALMLCFMPCAAMELVGFPMVEIVPQETNEVRSWFVGDAIAVVNSGGDWFMMIQLIFSSTKSRLDLLEKMREECGERIWDGTVLPVVTLMAGGTIDVLHHNPVLDLYSVQ